MKIQLGSKPEKDLNVPKRDSDKTPVTAATIRMSQPVAKTTLSIGQALSVKVAVKPPAVSSGGSFGKTPGVAVATPTALATPTSQAGKGLPPGTGKPPPGSVLASWASEMLVKSVVGDAPPTKSTISPGKSSLLPTPVSSRVVVTQPSPVQDTSGRKPLLPTPNSAGQIQKDPGWSRYAAGGDMKSKTDSEETPAKQTPAKDVPSIKTNVVTSGVKKTPLQGIPMRYVV